MIIRIFFSILLIISNVLTAKESITALSAKARHQLYSFDFDTAAKTFDKILELDKEHPAGYYYYALMHLWFYLGSKDEGDLGAYSYYSGVAILNAENLLKNNENSDQVNFYLANLYQLKAIAQATQGNTFDAFWAAKNAVRHYERCLEINPDFNDAYLGLGMFKYALSFVPSMFKWALNLAGLEYDKREGLRDLLTAYKKGKQAQVEAAFHLGKVYTEYNAEYDSARIYLEWLTEKYPRNSLFLYQLAILEIEEKRLSPAGRLLDRIIELDYGKFSQTNSYALFLKAEIEFRRNEYENALKLYQEFIETSKSFDYTGIAYLNSAVCYFALGEEIEANRALLLAKNGNLDIADDDFAKKRSKIYFESPLKKNELKAIAAINNFYNAKYGTAYDSLISVVDSLENHSIQGEALLILGEISILRKKYDDALKFAYNASEMKLNNDKWIKAYAALLTAKAYWKLRNYDAAKSNLNIAEELNDYDYRLKIEGKINFLKNRLFFNK